MVAEYESETRTSLAEAIDFVSMSIASLRQSMLHLDEMKAELEALKAHNAKAEPGRLSDRVQGILTTLHELERRWDNQLTRME